MALYAIPVRIYATLYVKADDADAAYLAARAIRDIPIIMETGGLISDRQYDDPRLPNVSLSPAMTIGDPDPESIEEVV